MQGNKITVKGGKKASKINQNKTTPNFQFTKISEGSSKIYSKKILHR